MTPHEMIKKQIEDMTIAKMNGHIVISNQYMIDFLQSVINLMEAE